MATTNKDFKVKNGLIVEGANATVAGNEVLTNAASINALSDVTISSPTSGQVLKWNGSAWVNDTGGAGGGISNVVEDTTPQLGGDLDAQGNSITDVESVQFDNTPTTEPSAAGSLWWNADQETLNLQLDSAVTLQIGQEHVIRVKNASGSTAIPEGRVVMFAGATGDTVTVSPADGSSLNIDYLVGITTEEIPAATSDTVGFGFVTQFGFVNGLDTTGAAAFGSETWSLGNLLYLDSVNDGYLTNVPPAAPNWKFPIAAVTRVGSGSSGRILVRAIPGKHLTDIVDVAISSPDDNELLAYNYADGTWINQTAAEAGLSVVGHTHDDRYYTETETDTLLSGKANTSHTHSGSDITSGTVAVANGGTGATTAADARVNLEAPKVYTQDSTPSSPTNGDLWLDSSEGITYLYYSDGDGSQWIEVSGINQSSVNQSPNFLINADFNIWQRGTSSTANAAYLADRWYYTRSAGTQTVSQSTNVPANQGFNYSLQFASTSGTDPVIMQRIEAEQSRKFAGKQVTFSIWAYSSVGTGGLAWAASYPTAKDNWTSDSQENSGTFTASMTVGQWTRYTTTFTPTSNASAGYAIKVYRNVTATSTTTLYAGAQLEVGSVVTPFRTNGRNTQEELLSCMRYFERIYDLQAPGFQDSSSLARGISAYQTVKRVDPTISTSATTALIGISAVGTDQQINYNDANLLFIPANTSWRLTYGASTVTSGQGLYFYISGPDYSTKYISFDSELN